MNGLFPTKRKIGPEISDNFESNGVIKKTKGNGVRSERFTLTEVKGDLFDSSDTVSLAHCVSQDLRFGKGIAAHFKSKFGGQNELGLGHKVGDVAVLKRGSRFIYNLITKERYCHKPTYVNLRSSLHALKAHALEHGVISLAMPRIGCGLDGLIWEKVAEIVTDVFKDTDVRITVYYI